MRRGLARVLTLTFCAVSDIYGQGNGRLQLHFIDVGQGDAALLISPLGEVVLFDNGPTTGCTKLVSYLKSLSVKRLDYHVATHYHADHIGCTADVLAQAPLARDALDRGGTYSSATFDKYLAAVGSHRKTAKSGMKIILDDVTGNPVEIEIVALNGNGTPTDNENDLSVVSVIRYGKFQTEIGGDLSGFKTGDYEDIETSVAGKVGPVEVYKVHHHASAYSSNQQWLARTTPLVGIVSVGSTNTYGHPAKECLDRLHAANVRTYWTEAGKGASPDPVRDLVAGDVVIDSDGTAFSVISAAGTDTYLTWEAAAGPTITGVVNAASFQPGMSGSAWIAIYGTNLASASRNWRSNEIIGGKLPTSLDGVSVTVDGRQVAVNYISPNQLNVQAPGDLGIGPVTVRVTTPQGTATGTAESRLFSPGLFTFDGKYLAAQHPDYSYVAKPGLLIGAPSTPARPGEVIILYGTGFGPTAPPLPSGEVIAAPAPLANTITVWIGNRLADVQWSGMSGAGLWQFNVAIPNDLPDGDASVVAEVGGVRTQANALITIQR